MKFVAKTIYFQAFLSAALLFTVNAYADDCQNLAGNEDWNRNFENLQYEIQTGNYDAAFQSANVLFGICPRSPALNYYLGIAFKDTGDDVKATMYFQKASEYTSEFTVTPEMSRQIWYARYEAEHPECSTFSMAAQKQKEAELNAQNDSLKLDIAAQNARLDAVNELNNTLTQKDQEALRKKYATLMWTGTGIGILGIAGTITGAVLVTHCDKYEDVTGPSTDTKRKYDIRPGYISGWVLIGAGASLAVAGAVMAGLGGYQYTHSNNDVAFHLNIVPNAAAMSLTF